MGRLILIAVLSFVVAGAAVLYTRDADLLDRYLPGRETPIETQAQTPAALEGFVTAIARPRQSEYMALTGFPAWLNVDFPLPRHGTVSAGRLTLDLNSQIASGGTGTVRVIVNDTQRGAIVVDQGRQTHRITVALEAEDLAADRVRVRLAATGETGGGRICPTGTGQGSVIALAKSSVLEIATDAPIGDPEDLFRLAAGPLTLYWGEDMPVRERTLALAAGRLLAAHGIGFHFADAAPEHRLLVRLGAETAAGDGVLHVADIAALNRLASARRDGASRAVPDAWPVTARALGASVEATAFERTIGWALNYGLADLPDTRVPDRLEVHLRATPPAGETELLVNTTLNGTLVDTRRLRPEGMDIAYGIVLPTDLQGARNTVRIALADPSPNDDICGTPPGGSAQLMGDTRLWSTGGVASRSADIGALVRALAERAGPYLDASAALDGGQAHQVSLLLDMLIARDTPLALGPSGGPALIAADRDKVLRHMASLGQALPDGRGLAGAMLVTLDAEGAIAVTPLAGADPETLAAGLDPRAGMLVVDLGPSAGLLSEAQAR